MWITFICLKIVDLPDSPAPSSKIFVTFTSFDISFTCSLASCFAFSAAAAASGVSVLLLPPPPQQNIVEETLCAQRPVCWLASQLWLATTLLGATKRPRYEIALCSAARRAPVPVS